MAKKQITLSIEEELLNKLRDAAYRSRLTLNSIMADQIEQFIKTDTLINGKCPARPHLMLAKGRKVKLIEIEGEQE
jgi:hypothetical protein